MKSDTEVSFPLFAFNRPMAFLLIFVIFVFLFLCQSAPAQNGLTVRGFVRSSNGPLANHVVMHMPFDETEQQPVIVYAGGPKVLSKQGSRNSAKEDWAYTYYVQEGRGILKNVRTLSNERGEFSLVIPDLKPVAGKQKYRIGIGVFSGGIDAPTLSNYEVVYFDVEVGKPTFDARNIELKAIKEKPPKP